MWRVTTTINRVTRPLPLFGAALAFAIFGGYVMSSASAPVPAAVIIPARPLPRQVASVAVRAPMPVDCAKVTCIALTFDDGPYATVTPRVLDILERQNVRATFFVLGVHVRGNEGILRRMHNGGYEIGNHSWGHPHFTEISLEQVEAEINNTQAVIAGAGVPAPHLFRPPYGDINDAVAAHIPLSVIRWNIDPEDWSPKHRAYMREHVAAYAKPGGVVILHDTEEHTVAMLESIILDLKAKNYTFVTVSELLSLAPGQQGIFFGR